MILVMFFYIFLIGIDDDIILLVSNVLEMIRL